MSIIKNNTAWIKTGIRVNIIKDGTIIKFNCTVLSNPVITEGCLTVNVSGLNNPVDVNCLKPVENNNVYSISKLYDSVIKIITEMNSSLTFCKELNTQMQDKILFIGKIIETSSEQLDKAGDDVFDMQQPKLFDESEGGRK